LIWRVYVLAHNPLQARHLTQDEYAMNHPAGRIGKRLILRVSDVMLTGDKIPKVAAHIKV
jgi:arabinose-5-phosphate isomerase